jgi:hypothetical protein
MWAYAYNIEAILKPLELPSDPLYTCIPPRCRIAAARAPKHTWAHRLCAAMGLGQKARDGIKKYYEALLLLLEVAYQSSSSAPYPSATAASEGAAEGAAAACPSPLERFRQKRPQHVVVDLSPFLYKCGWSKTHPEKRVAMLLRSLWPALQQAPLGTTFHVSLRT